MEAFSFYNPTRILFGDGQLSQLSQETQRYGKRVLMAYGGGSIQKSGLYDEVIAELKAAQCEVWELGGIHANPLLSPVYEGIRTVKENHIQWLLAVGGGSVVDTCKAIAAGAVIEQDVWMIFNHKQAAKSALPIGVVLTIPAAGSESSNSAVITKEEGQLKYAFSAECIIPAFAILEPKRTYTLLAYQTACGAADMLCHVLERYLCENGLDDLMDGICEAVMRTIVRQTPIAIKQPEHAIARAQLMWAGTLAHNNLLGSGRKQDWSAHGIEHELSALYNIAHGAGMALIMPAWMEYCAETLQGAIARLAVQVFGAEKNLSARELTQSGIQSLRAFFKSIELPATLEKMQIDDTRFAEMAQRCVREGTIGDVCKLTVGDVENIFRLVM